MAVSLGPFQRATAVQWPSTGWERIGDRASFPTVSQVNPVFLGWDTTAAAHVVIASEPTSPSGRVWTYTPASGYVLSVSAPSAPLDSIAAGAWAYTGAGKVLAGWNSTSDGAVRLAEADLGGSWSTVFTMQDGPVNIGDPDIEYNNLASFVRVPGTDDVYFIASGLGADNPGGGLPELWLWDGSTATYQGPLSFSFVIQEVFVYSGTFYYRDFVGWRQFTGSGSISVDAQFKAPDGVRMIFPTIADTKILSKPGATYSGVPGSWERIAPEDDGSPFPQVALESGNGWDPVAKVWRQVNRDPFSDPDFAGLWQYKPPADKF